MQVCVVSRPTGITRPEPSAQIEMKGGRNTRLEDVGKMAPSFSCLKARPAPAPAPPLAPPLLVFIVQYHTGARQQNCDKNISEKINDY